MNIKDFKKRKKQKQTSVLDKFRTEILELHNDNYSLATIQEFLKLNGVLTSITIQNISHYIKKIKMARENGAQLEKQKEEETISVYKNVIKKPEKELENKKTDSIPSLTFEKVGKNYEIADTPEWAK